MTVSESVGKSVLFGVGLTFFVLLARIVENPTRFRVPTTFFSFLNHHAANLTWARVLADHGLKHLAMCRAKTNGIFAICAEAALRALECDDVVVDRLPSPSLHKLRAFF